MTTSQKLSIRLSEIRQVINELTSKETLAEGEQAKLDELRIEFSAKGTQWRAAETVEAEEESRAQGQFEDGDGEAAETRALLRDSHLTDYMTAASAGLGLTGASAELNSALQVPVAGAGGGVAVPWAMLENRQAVQRRAQANGNGEHRAFTDTGDLAGGVMQRPVLQRLFGVGILDALGVRVDSVPAGRTEWPLLTGGVAPVQKAEGTASDAAVAATFSTETLKPKRLTGRYEFTHVMAAQVPMLESALRRDLADAVKSKMSDLILNGNESTNAHEPDGFLTKLAVPTAPGAESGFADYAGAAAQAVDGIHASMESEVAAVIGVASYKHAASIYQTSGSGESASEALKRRSMSLMASSFVPAVAATVQTGNIIHAAGPNGGGPDMRADSIAAIWPSLEILRDPYSKSSQGVVLTWVSLWDAETAFRAAAYKRVSFQVS